MKSWHLPALIVLGLVLLSLPFAISTTQKSQELRRRAAEDITPEANQSQDSVRLVVDPSTQNVTPGDPVAVQVVLYPQTNQISGPKFRLMFNPLYLSNPEVILGEVFEHQINFDSPVIKENYVEVAMARSPGTTAYTGTPIAVATITFTTSPSATGTTQLEFEAENTQVFNIQTINILEEISPGFIVFSTTGEPTTPPTGPATPTDSPHAFCEDLDLNNPQVKGTTRDHTGSYTDYCYDDNDLWEYICSFDPDPHSEKVFQPCTSDGAYCDDGACRQDYNPLTPTPDPSLFCYDPDGGYNLSTRGTGFNNAGIQSDYCVDEQTLAEFYCHLGPPGGYEQFDCLQYGFVGCVDGACLLSLPPIPTPTPTLNPQAFCNDPDGGYDIYNKTTVTTDKGEFTDFCVDENILIEFYCLHARDGEENPYAHPDSQDCTLVSATCQDGTCVPTSTTITPSPPPVACNQSDLGVFSVQNYTRPDGNPGIEVTVSSQTMYSHPALAYTQEGADRVYYGSPPIFTQGNPHTWYWDVIRPANPHYQLEFIINHTPDQNGEACGEWYSYTPPGSDTLTITQATLEPVVKWLGIYTLTVKATSTHSPDAALSLHDLKIWPLIREGDYPMEYHHPSNDYHFSRWIFTLPKQVTVISSLGGSATADVTFVGEFPTPTPTPPTPTLPPPSEEVSLSINPGYQTSQPGDQVSASVVLDPAEEQISGIRFRLQFPQELSNPQIDIGSIFPNQINLGSPIIGDGFLEVALIRSPGTSPYTGNSATVSTITFDSSLAASEAVNLDFDPNNTEIFNLDTVDVLSQTIPGVIDFGGTSPGASINFFIKFRGIDVRRPDQYVRVTIVRGQEKQVIHNVQVVSDQYGVYAGAATGISLPAGDGYTIYIKGPKHLQRRYCTDNQVARCSGAGSLTLSSENNTFDFSGLPLEPGDLPDPLLDWQQDGVVNAHDGSLLVDRLFSSEELDLAVADLNLDGIVNAHDYSLILETLSTKWEEDSINIL